jgi:Xaa-Pro aminopeptidase
MLAFEPLTLVPIDRAMIVPDLLTEDEAGWLDGYHAHVRAVIGPRLQGADRAWLERATAPLPA